MMLSYQEFRCTQCKKLLFKGLLIDSAIEIKCRHCRELVVIKSSSKNEFLCAVRHCPQRVKMEG